MDGEDNKSFREKMIILNILYTSMGDKESDEKKKRPHEMHNSELVSKLMAATPSYFFTPISSQTGHNFFFSELLRSLAQKRKSDELSYSMKSKLVSKKSRKQLPLYYQKPFEAEWKKQKLNDGQNKITYCVSENEDPKNISPHLNAENSQDSVINVDKDDSPPAPTLCNAGPYREGSAFYPFVDPLHNFLIDLKVSTEQVYDKKKEAFQALKNNILLDSNTWSSPIIGKNRAGSAFRVPGTFNERSNNYSAINLIANNHQMANDSIAGSEDIEVQIFDVETKPTEKDKPN